MTDTNLNKKNFSNNIIFYLMFIINFLISLIQNFIIFLKKINPFNVPENYKSPYQNKDTMLDIKKINKGKKNIMGVPLNYKARIFSQIFHQANNIRKEYYQEKKIMEKEKKRRERRENRNRNINENNDDDDNNVINNNSDNNSENSVDNKYDEFLISDDEDNNIITNKHPHDD